MNKNQYTPYSTVKNFSEQKIKMWNILRSIRFYFLNFERKVRIGRYVLDFVCEDKKVIILVNDNIEDNFKKKQLHQNKINYLVNKGYCVINFYNNEFDYDDDKVAHRLNLLLKHFKVI